MNNMVYPKYYEFTVKGAKVAVYPMRDVESVAIDVMIRAGAWYEGRRWGAFHMLEHLTMDGTKKFPDELALELFKEENGIRSNAWTSQSDTGYWAQFPAKVMGAGFEFIFDCVFNPLLLPKDMEREISVITQEHKDTWSSPYQRFWKSQMRQMYGSSHPYARHAVGWPKYLKTLKRSDLVSLHREYFSGPNMVISVAGKIGRDEVYEQLLAVLPPKKGEKKMAFLPAIKSKSPYLWHKEDVRQVGINLTWLTLGRMDLSFKERLTLRLAAYLIGGSARSLLFKKLRMETGLVYSTGAKWSWNPTMGTFVAYANTSPENAQKVFPLMQEIVSSFPKMEIKKADLERAKNYLNSGLLMSYDSPGNIADQMADDLFWSSRVIPIEEYLETSNQIKASELKEAVAAFLKKTPFVSVISSQDPKLI